jgi:hypothetical protein
LKNFSVIILLFVCITACAREHAVDTLPDIPPAKGRVNDFVQLFSTSETQGLDS